jgi:aromatic ring-opening dioxygenase catalytic subunit (LigB family)
MRQPAIYIPHGGGPWPFIPLDGMVKPEDAKSLLEYLEKLPATLPAPPKAILVISAHWEAAQPTLMTSPHPPMLYDYGGFPPAAYELKWPAPGAPALADRVGKLLGDAGIPTRTDPKRGFDHGTFVPLMVSWPKHDVPVLQLSLKTGLDPAEHLAIGKALAPLRDEGIVIIGSGMSYHNMRAFFDGSGHRASVAFDTWLQKAATAPAAERAQSLRDWAKAPSARESHPREEHLLPLMVVAGAAGADPGRVTWTHDWMNTRITAIQYG